MLNLIVRNRYIGDLFINKDGTALYKAIKENASHMEEINDRYQRVESMLDEDFYTQFPKGHLQVAFWSWK